MKCNGRREPLRGQTTGCCVSEARSHQQGGRGGVKQTHPTAQIDGLCCGLSVIHTDGETDRRKSGDKLCFYACPVSHFTVFHTKLLPVFEE